MPQTNTVDGKKGVLDASSAILLFKANLFHTLLETYRIVMAASVYAELNKPGYPGAETFRKCQDHHRVRIMTAPSGQRLESDLEAGLSALDRGERDTIRCFWAGFGDFIVTDDREAARHCKSHRIPCINALLFPRVLFFSGHLRVDECRRKAAELVRIGRYSATIIDVATHRSRQDLLPFLP
jgi:hypothetical protein